jgi:hypothetical protein
VRLKTLHTFLLSILIFERHYQRLRNVLMRLSLKSAYSELPQITEVIVLGFESQASCVLECANVDLENI